MQKNIHPNWNSKAKVIFNGQTIMLAGSTKAELNVEIWAGNHPFYTGQELLVDTDNLVDRFEKKRAAAAQNAGALVSKKEKRQKRRTSTDGKSLTLRDMLKDIQ